MKALNIDNASHIDLCEAKTNLLTALEKKFGQDTVYSDELNFEFDSKSFSDIYALLNAHLFNNELKTNNLYSYNCSNDDLKHFIHKMNISTNNVQYYAAYVPEVNIKTNEIQKESILFFDDNGKMTFLFAVSCLCHEMIHQYDAHYGIWLKLAKEDSILGIDRSHDTPVFVKYSKLAALEGIRVMTNSGNTPFDILNKEAIQFTMNLQEDDSEKLKNLAERLKAGEKIPNVCLTNRNTIAFFVP